MNTTTNTRGVKYTPEQVERQASILSDTWGVGEAYKMLRAYAATLKAAQGGVTEAMVDECHHDWVDYVQAEYKPRHRVIELGESNIERYVRIGLMCTICGKEKAALSPEPAAQGEAVPVAFLNTKYRTLFHASEIGCTERNAELIASGELVRLYTAPPAQPAEAYFHDANALADWLESLHECHTDGAVGNRKWEVAQIAAKAVRGAAQPAERAPDGWRVLQIGAIGSAYDPPNTRRAFTYDWQPGNGGAWALGMASSTAAKTSAGDYIDGGLNLLKALQEQGFGVFQIEPASPAPSEGGKGVEG